MKTFKFFLLSFLFISIVNFASAQTRTEKIAVSGECGMCKTKIEKAAKDAGASFAVWDVDSKVLTVKYKSTSTNTAKIENAVANVGYDTKNVKASDDAYSKLHSCCQYERTSASTSAHSCGDDAKCDHSSCMKDGKCDHSACMKDGKCKDMSKCKESAGGSKDCCKKA